MIRSIVQIGPNDQGKHMSLADFDHAEGREGYIYELSRGVIIVMDVPGKKHLAQLEAARDQFYSYKLSHRGLIHTIASGGDCKILMPTAQSERHPDLSIYKSPPPPSEELWTTWIPEIAIEIVSPGSHHRDYGEKREEYFQFGVREYWIIDADPQQMLALRRSGGRWIEKIVQANETYRTRLLPELEFNLAPIFESAHGAS
ncbi:MAG TPA: Uma2 family endonuclease [Humisphaera sp.]|nr:Uma2 family endonuclease [Humisphaera sp.]